MSNIVTTRANRGPRKMGTTSKSLLNVVTTRANIGLRKMERLSVCLSNRRHPWWLLTGKTGFRQEIDRHTVPQARLASGKLR